MTSLRASKGLGVAGTLLTHCVIFAACFLVVPKATPTPLPPAVEAVRFSLSDPVASAGTAGAPAASEPEPQTAEPVPVAETPAPTVEKIPSKDTLPVAQIMPEKPKVDKPRTPPVPQVPRAPRRPSPQAANSEAVGSGGGGGSAAGAPAVGSGSLVQEARQTLLSALRARIEREKRYPTAARRLGLEGRVMAVVQVDGQGRIIAVDAQGGDAPPVLEKAALEALQRVREDWTPVPVPEPMTLHIPIRYSLSKS